MEECRIWKSVRLEGCRIGRVYIIGRMQDWKGEGLEGSRIGIVQDWTSVGLEGFKTGRVKDWKSVRLEECKIGRM